MVLIAILITFSVISNLFAQSNFLTDQKRYKRVRKAILEKQQLIEANLKNFNIQIDSLNIIIVAYKAERKLELFAKNHQDTSFRKICTYNICSSSGVPGPKRRQGDFQVPEGFYSIDRFNPASRFYLSLGLNYPNNSDKLKSKAKNFGGDIFIHGSCVTIGCLPMTDDKIKEIYLYAIHAKNNGQNNIPVYIFPFKMTTENLEKYKKKYKANLQLLDFWSDIHEGYVNFQKSKNELIYSIDTYGSYLIQ
ncbi:MAG: L,D-transpeptidase family protein [Bacteroidales bacterium]|nr:L,D-transpeptidase family protein [Bacteroidales bacterium]